MKKRKLHGSPKRIIRPALPHEPEKAKILIHEADDLYKEIRIENVVIEEMGEKATLKQGEDVDIVLEANPDKHEKSWLLRENCWADVGSMKFCNCGGSLTAKKSRLRNSPSVRKWRSWSGGRCVVRQRTNPGR